MKRTPMKRTGGPKRKPRKRYDPVKAEEFWVQVCHHPLKRATDVRRRRRRCVVCGHTAQDAHHILAKQFVWSECKTARVDADNYLWDLRNGLALCRHCHDAHEGGSERLSRAVISQAAWDFIGSVDHLSGTLRATETIVRAYR